ncbi:MAG: hypothetical protein MR571_05840 [Succinatimonas sp.]|nr:hypothetical protein [Succinatimonas sp.]
MDVNAASSELFTTTVSFFYGIEQNSAAINDHSRNGDDNCMSTVELHSSTSNSGEFSHNRLKAKLAYLTGNCRHATDDQQNPDNVPVKNGQELTAKEQEKVEKLKERDKEVRAHERAHQSAGGEYAGSPSYDYEKGPDGNDYAIGGHVNIDVAEENTPEKTLQKMEQIIRAAKAPADPSTQDLKVAAQAQQKAAKARAEIASNSPAVSDTKNQKI